MCWCSITSFLDNSIKVFSILGIVLALWQYRINSRREKSKWLSELHESFFVNQTYKEIRKYIDYETGEFETLKSILGRSEQVDLQEKFVDYLNFFEFISTLEKLGQLSINEVNLTFGYYLRLIGEYEFIIRFIENNGFTNLKSLIKRSNNLNK
ncbi:MAG: hypothetical protein ABI723_10090 [Bacteroidia bacterium]